MRLGLIGVSLAILSIAQALAPPLLRYKGIVLPSWMLEVLWSSMWGMGGFAVGILIYAVLLRRSPELPISPTTPPPSTTNVSGAGGSIAGGDITAGRDVVNITIPPPAPPALEPRAAPRRPRITESSQIGHFNHMFFCWQLPPAFFRDARHVFDTSYEMLDELIKGPFCPECSLHLRHAPPRTNKFDEFYAVGDPMGVGGWTVEETVHRPCTCGWKQEGPTILSTDLYALKDAVYREAQRLLRTKGNDAFSFGPCPDTRRPAITSASSDAPSADLRVGLVIACDLVIGNAPDQRLYNILQLETVPEGTLLSGLIQRGVGIGEPSPFHHFHFGSVARWTLTNYGTTPVFNVSLVLKSSFREAVRVKAGGTTNGKVVFSRDWIVNIGKLDPGISSPFVFYAVNLSPYYVDIIPPQSATLEVLGEEAQRRTFPVKPTASVLGYGLVPSPPATSDPQPPSESSPAPQSNPSTTSPGLIIPPPQV
jgi:hypothetical protein